MAAGPIVPTGPEFPDYTVAEKAVDAVVHVLGLSGASVAVGLLLVRCGPAATQRQFAALIVYSMGLLGMLSASALYNVMPVGWLKARLRHLDHAMIFVMIACSYTPFAMTALRPALGVPLCVVVWLLAASGIGLRLLYSRLYKRISLGLYLGMGWLVLGVLPWLAAAVSSYVLLLLLLGGVIYSIGSLVQVQERMPFHNAVWHAMVIAAAAVHMTAVANL